MPPEKTRDYEVGYAKPPRQTQFKKGQSGNPKGRPVGAKTLIKGLHHNAYRCRDSEESGLFTRISSVCG